MKKILLILILVLLSAPVMAGTKTTKVYVTSTNDTVTIRDEDYDSITSFSKNTIFTDAQYFFSIDYDCPQMNTSCNVNCAAVSCPALPSIPSCPSTTIPECPAYPTDNSTNECLTVLDRKINPLTKGLTTQDYILLGGAVLLILAAIFFPVFKSKKPKEYWPEEKIRHVPEQQTERFKYDKPPQKENFKYHGDIQYKGLEQSRPEQRPQAKQEQQPIRQDQPTHTVYDEPPARDVPPPRPRVSDERERELEDKIKKRIPDAY